MYRQDIIHIGNLQGQEIIAGILDHLRRTSAYRHNGQLKGLIDLFQHSLRLPALRADNDARRMKRIVHRGSLCQKFRIGGHFYLHIPDQEISDKLLHLVIGAHRNRGFHHHQTVPLHRLCDLSGNRRDIA